MLLRFSLPVLLVSLIGLTGCGPAETTVSGVISYEGKNLNSGVVTMKSGDKTLSSDISSEGSYTIKGVPVGEATISVMVPPPPPKGGGPEGAIEDTTSVSNPVQIPEKYSDLATSGLTFEVTSGDPTHNIELVK